MIAGFHHECFVRFIAPYPGLWPEIGVLDDQRLLRRLRRVRRQLGLPADYHLADAQGPAATPRREA